MSGTPPERFKPMENWTPDEHLEYRRTGQEPESDEYRAHRHKVLTDAGLESDDPGPKELDELSPSEHAARKYGVPR